MKAILKKYKITKTILQQSLRPTQYEISDLEVLGWCIYKTGKISISFIVLHDEKKGIIKRIPKIKEIEESFLDAYKGSIYFTPKRWEIKIKSAGNYKNVSYYFDNEVDPIAFKSDIESLIEKAEEKGQFYI